jgi:hypothetical protein
MSVCSKSNFSVYKLQEVAVMRDSSKRIKKSVASMKSDMQKAWSKNLLEAAQTEILTICCM